MLKPYSMKKFRDQFEAETEIHWENEQGEPDIDYVEWLESQLENWIKIAEARGVVIGHVNL